MTRPAVLFPDVEQQVRDYLLPLCAVPVVCEIPKPRPDEFVRVRRTGGPRVTVVTEIAQLTIEGYGPDEASAFDALAEARAYLGASPGHVVDSGAATFTTYDEFSGPANLPDPLTDQARYTMTVSIGVRGREVTGS